MPKNGKARKRLGKMGTQLIKAARRSKVWNEAHIPGNGGTEQMTKEEKLLIAKAEEEANGATRATKKMENSEPRPVANAKEGVQGHS